MAGSIRSGPTLGCTHPANGCPRAANGCMEAANGDGLVSTERSLRVAELDQNSEQALGVKERHLASLGAGAGPRVDELDPRRLRARQRSFEVVDLEAHVVNSRAAGLEEARD